MSLAVNVLRKGLKNFHVSKSDFCNSITFTVIIRAGKGAFIKNESVFRTVYHVALFSRFFNTFTADDNYSLISRDN